MEKQKIIFRVDGNSKIGFGHISRCLALGEIVSLNYAISFAVRYSDHNVISILRDGAHEVIELSPADPVNPLSVGELGPYLTGKEIVVLDGYHFSLEYELWLKKHASAVVCIDDIPNRHFASDVIFNFCGLISKSDYSHEFYTQLFLGLEFVFLRSPFLRIPPKRKTNKNRLFLNMGGADSNNDTVRILYTLASLNYPGEIEVVVGSNYAYAESLDAVRNGWDSIEVHWGLNAAEMHNSMSRCDLAIVPPSTVALEFLSTGGLVFLHQTAPNQELQMKYLLQSRMAFDFVDFKSIALNDSELYFQKSIVRQKEVFDGTSIIRVQKIFDTIGISSQVSLRRAKASDAKQCFDWANEPEIRRYSYSSAPIEWDQHVMWFNRKLADSTCYYFIAGMANVNVGQIRFDFLEDEGAFQISYAIDRKWRGKGLGYLLLVKGIQKLRELNDLKRVIGYVQKVNTASVKTFEKAGFDVQLSEKYTDSFKFELSFNGV